MSLPPLRELLARQGIRFALVGVFNTAFGYGVFVLLELTLGGVVPYLVNLMLAYVVGVTEAFAAQRVLVFRAQGPWLSSYLRFWSVYVVSLGVNLVLLRLFVEVLGAPVLLAQPVVLLLLAAGTYLAHRSFSFRPARL